MTQREHAKRCGTATIENIMTDLLIGLDAGTTTLSAVALDARDGSLRAVETAANDAALPPDTPGAAEQDATAITRKSLDLLARLAARPEVQDARFLALGVTGQMHGVVLVQVNGASSDSASSGNASSGNASGDDANDAPLTPLISWRDARGNDPCASSGRSHADELAHRLGAAAVERSGCVPASGYGGVTLLRTLEENALPPRATALSLPDFLVRALCGVAATGPDLAASWGLFDAAGGNGWLPEARDALRLNNRRNLQHVALLPPVLPPHTVAGALAPQAARVTGLPFGLPVAVAMGDNQASFWGSVFWQSVFGESAFGESAFGESAFGEGASSGAIAWRRSLLLNLGTGGQMSAPVGNFRRVPGLETRPLASGHWLLVGASLCGGRAYDLLRRFFAAVGSQLFGIENSENEQASDALFERMNQLAAQVPAGCDGLTALPLFDGTRLDPAQRARLDGLSAQNFTPGHLSRAVIAGMVDELFGFYNAAREAGATAQKVFGAGNAIRRNPVVRHEIERRFALPLRLPPHREEAAVGAALSGGIAVGALRLG